MQSMNVGVCSPSANDTSGCKRRRFSRLAGGAAFFPLKYLGARPPRLFTTSLPVAFSPQCVMPRQTVDPNFSASVSSPATRSATKNRFPRLHCCQPQPPLGLRIVWDWAGCVICGSMLVMCVLESGRYRCLILGEEDWFCCFCRSMASMKVCASFAVGSGTAMVTPSMSPSTCRGLEA